MRIVKTTILVMFGLGLIVSDRSNAQVVLPSQSVSNTNQVPVIELKKNEPMQTQRERIAIRGVWGFGISVNDGLKKATNEYFRAAHFQEDAQIWQPEFSIGVEYRFTRKMSVVPGMMFSIHYNQDSKWDPYWGDVKPPPIHLVRYQILFTVNYRYYLIESEQKTIFWKGTLGYPSYFTSGENKLTTNPNGITLGLGLGYFGKKNIDINPLGFELGFLTFPVSVRYPYNETPYGTASRYRVAKYNDTFIAYYLKMIRTF
ncbi:MAG: hypothetical protein OEM52_01510 [bacterium]|nr:hypothetical protein [bacterium]